MGWKGGEADLLRPLFAAGGLETDYSWMMKLRVTAMGTATPSRVAGL